MKQKNCKKSCKKKEKVEELVIPKETIIKLNGIPFELPKDTKVLGLKSNLELAKSIALNNFKDFS